MLLKNKWLDRYLDVAEHHSLWSKDTTKVGAVCVGKHGQELSHGYNGFPRGVEDAPERLSDRETKLKFVVHAEMNCIYAATLNGVSLDGSDIYVHGLPVCSECAKGIIQVGIKRVFMRYPEELEATERWIESFKISSVMLNEAGVQWTIIPA